MKHDIYTTVNIYDRFFVVHAKIYAAIVPIYDPVNGTGIITKTIKPQTPYFLTKLFVLPLALNDNAMALFLYHLF